MSDANVIFITGGVGQDPEEKQGSVKIAKISVANERGFGEKKTTNWFNCVAFQKQAEFILKYVRKGARVRVIGEMAMKKYEGKTYPEIKIQEISFEGGNPKKEYSSTPEKNNNPDKQPLFDDCAPFPDDEQF